MKKFRKLFLLALCSGFLLLGFSNAQSGIEQDSYTEELNISTNKSGDYKNSESNSLDTNRQDPAAEPNFYTDQQRCTCGINLLAFSVWILLRGIEILLGIILVITSLKTISLYKKPENTYRHNRLFCLPMINLYPLSKITIGKSQFFVLILLLGFFVYDIYAYKVFRYNDLCCDNPIRQGYFGIIVGILAIVILGALLSKLSYLTKSSQKNSGKKPSDKIE